jgi:hypothetical protein
MLGVDPVAIVHSGHGLQPHWAIERSDVTDWPDETDPRWSDALALHRRWGRLVAGVAHRHGGRHDSVCEPARVMRVPGAANNKIPTQPVATTVEWRTAPATSLERLAEVLDEYGITELAGDRDTLGETVSPPSEWDYAARTCGYVAKMVAGWASDTPEARHPWMMSQATRLACAHRLGCISETDHETAVERLAERFVYLLEHTQIPRAPQRGEVSEGLSWGVAKAASKTEAEARKELGNHLHQETPAPTALAGVDEEAFWSDPVLAHIRTSAWAQMASPWAVLGNVLAHIICQTPVTVVLPDVIHDYASLNLTIALVGPSGSGKGGSSGVARHSVDIGPHRFDTHTLGSGHGIAHGYGHWDKTTKMVVRHADSVLFTVEEVDHLVGLAQQNGSTTLAELRRFSMGEKLGHLFVDPTRRVQIDAHTYRGAVIVSVQPARAGVLLNDADGGTPQRFLWLPTIDRNAPDVEPDWPGERTWNTPGANELPAVSRFGLRPLPICDTARSAIRDAQRARNRGEGDPLDGHALLTRERVAAALGLLRSYYAITEEDWELAGTVMAISDATRTGVSAALAAQGRQANEARAHQEADREEVKENRQDQRVARRLLDHLHRQGDSVWHNELRKVLASRDRQAFESAVANLVAAGQVEREAVTSVPGQGRPGVRYRAVTQ